MSSIPTSTISRLVVYLRILEHLEHEGVRNTSSEHLAEASHGHAFVVRKDLAYFGRFGTRGAGYSVPILRREVRRILGLTRAWNVVIVGVGRLGSALAHYPQLEHYDFFLKGLVDSDPKKLGREEAGLHIQSLETLASLIMEKGIDLGILCVPPDAAQTSADALVAAGIKGILNFSPTLLQVPPDIHVENVDVLVGLKRLVFYTVNPQLQAELV